MGIKRMHTPDQRAALSVLELTDHEVGGYRCLTRHLLHEEWHAPQAGWCDCPASSSLAMLAATRRASSRSSAMSCL